MIANDFGNDAIGIKECFVKHKNSFGALPGIEENGESGASLNQTGNFGPN